MSFSLISIDPNSDLWVASNFMPQEISKLPIIDDVKGVGIISSSDLAKHIADH
jgi:CBS domain-containing protein